MGKRKLYMFAALLAASLLICFVPREAEAATSSEIRQQIDALEQEQAALEDELDALQQQLDQNLSQTKDAVEEKDNIDRQIALLHEKMNNTNAQINAYAVLIADQQEALEEAEARLTQLNQKHKDRIRAIEEQGELTYWSVLFEANSFSDFLDRFHMIQEITESDNRRLQELSDAAKEVAEIREELVKEKSALQASREQLLQDQEELEEKRAKADALLQSLVAKNEEFELLMQKSEEAQEQLMQQIAQMENEYDKKAEEEWLATSVPGVTGGTSAQGWITPVPYYTLTSPFGMRLHPLLGIYRMHNGVDMSCDAMTPIYASRSGYVTVTAYQEEGAGNYVQLNHGDGYRSIYMHMTYYIVSMGEYVEQGQVIGYVGSSGLSSGNHLHFGISYNGTYVNPMEYLP